MNSSKKHRSSVEKASSVNKNRVFGPFFVSENSNVNSNAQKQKTLATQCLQGFYLIFVARRGIEPLLPE